MARYKFPLTRREKYAIFGGEDRELEELDDQEFYIKGAIYKPSTVTNRDGTIALQPINHEKKKHAIPPEIYKRFFENKQFPLATNEDSWSNVVAASSPNSTDFTPAAGDSARVSVGSQQEVVSMHPAGAPLNTTLGTIPEEKSIDPGDFIIKYYASYTDMFWCVWTMLTYLADVGTDIWVAVVLYLSGHVWWFVITLSFVAVPAVTMTVFSLVLYLRDWRVVGDKVSPCRWISRSMFLLLQMAPLLRTIDTFLYGCRSRQTKDTSKQKALYDRMIDEDVDSTLMRLFEAFMEAAPQLVLQLYIMTQIPSTGWLLTAQIVGISTSLVNLSMTLVTFQKALRVSQPDKAILTRPGIVFMFLWRCFTIAARVLALAMFASKFHYFVFVVAFAHWVAMLVWVFMQDSQYCMLVDKEGKENHSKFLEFSFRFLTAFVQIFCFFNIIEGHTRLRCLVYYTVVFLENTAMIMAFYLSASVQGTPEKYDTPVMLFVTLGFFAGILLQVFYYKCCHPNNYSYMHEDYSIKWWVSWNRLSLCREITLNLDELDAVEQEEEEREEMYPKPVLKKRAPATQYLRRTPSKRSSTGSSDSNRSNFEHKTELDDASRAKLNLSYKTPQTLDDLVKPPQPQNSTTTV